MRAEAFPVAQTSALNLSPALARGILLAAIAGGLTAALLATNPAATALAAQHDGAALTRLMRFMAVIKTGLALLALGAVLWRLALPVSPRRLTAYALGAAAMAAGPGFIWGMAYIGWGALLLHGGLLGSVLLLWRDAAFAARLDALVAARRACVFALERNDPNT